MYILLFNLVIFLAIGIAFYKIYSNTTTGIIDPDLIYFERGGGWVGMNAVWMLQLTWPFVTIHLYKDSLLLNYGGKKVNLKYSEITKVNLLYIPIIAEGIRIYHDNPNQPMLLRFWSLGKSRKLKNLLDTQLNKSA